MAKTSEESEGMTMVCPHCTSACVRRRVRLGGYKCIKCLRVFDTSLEVKEERKTVHAGGRVTAAERVRRLQRIREVHQANPEYTKKDLRMVCFESDWMVAKYWKHYRVESSEIAINKTV